MRIVKVRRVGNSDVITLPKDLGVPGFEPGSEVAIEVLPSGGLCVMSQQQLRERVRAIGRQVIEEDREALEMLTAYDRGEDVPRKASAASR